MSNLSIKYKRPRLISKLLGSASLKALATELSARYGRRIWRAKTPSAKHENLLYGDCCDKLTQYRFFEANALPSVPYTTNKQVVYQWLQAGNTVFARTLITASEGRGIVQITGTVDMVSAPVYTQYVPKKREFRIHVFKTQVVATLEKKRKTDGSYQGESKVRNTANGYIFCQGTILETSLALRVQELALAGRKVTKSDFCGVDIGYNEKKDFLFLIEVNSAPGIQGSNITKYVDAIVAHCQGQV